MPKHHKLRKISALFAGALFTLGLSAAGHAQSGNDDMFGRLASAAPKLSPQVLEAALKATRCAISNGTAMPERLAVIDFSLPSSKERLWLFDLNEGELILRDLVAHGKNSGNAEATAFSNIEGSYQSSIGLFKAAESYRGSHGYSLRLDGLEPGFNDLARQRAIVIHGADYVQDSWVTKYGRIGRSHGCPAVDNQIIKTVVDELKGGQLVFKYYPDQKWLQASSYLNCDSAGQLAGARNATAQAGDRS